MGAVSDGMIFVEVRDRSRGTGRGRGDGGQKGWGGPVVGEGERGRGAQRSGAECSDRWRTNMVELRGLLQERDFVPCASDANRSCETTEAGTDDGDVEGRVTHYFAYSLWAIEMVGLGGLETEGLGERRKDPESMKNRESIRMSDVRSWDDEKRACFDVSMFLVRFGHYLPKSDLHDHARHADAMLGHLRLACRLRRIADNGKGTEAKGQDEQRSRQNQNGHTDRLLGKKGSYVVSGAPTPRYQRLSPRNRRTKSHERILHSSSFIYSVRSVPRRCTKKPSKRLPHTT